MDIFKIAQESLLVNIFVQFSCTFILTFEDLALILTLRSNF
nr:MAG TPA: hypothetical protein [Bacteriophage sp.]